MSAGQAGDLTTGRPSRLLAGIDGGGTKTLCVVHDLLSGRTGAGTGGAINLNYISEIAARGAISVAVKAACASVDAVPADLVAVAAAAPWTEHLIADVLCQLGARPERVETPGEDVCALMATLCQPFGLVLTAGTGSRCAYISPETDRAPIVAGAWGSLFGDEGSGYAIGAAALRAICQAWDGRGAPTGLSAALKAHWRLTTEKDLIRVVYGAPAGAWRHRIASLSPLVGSMAEAGDRVARSILRNATKDLAAMVAVVTERAGLTGPVVVVTSGGVFGLGRALTAPLRRALALRDVDAELVPEQLPAAHGALLLAAAGGGFMSPTELAPLLAAHHSAGLARQGSESQSHV